MIVTINHGKRIRLRSLQADDSGRLLNYLDGLSIDTRRRFGPHSFDGHTIETICLNPPPGELRFVADDTETSEIIAYAIIKKGYLLHDADRLSNYGLQLSGESDCTFAPSVADGWQSSGLGSKLFEFILSQTRSMNFKRIILWGGVQATNEKAIRFYQKFNFRTLGEFEYNGKNFDMILEI